MIKKGFTTVELLVTLFIAALFLAAGYQLYVYVMRNDGNVRAQSLASNVANQYMSQYAAQAAGSACNASTLLNASPIAVTGLVNTTVTVAESCPGSAAQSIACRTAPALTTSPPVAKVDVVVHYNQPAQQVEYSTYAKVPSTPSGTTPVGATVSTLYNDDTGSQLFDAHPSGITVDANGNVFVTSRDNNRILKITPSGSPSVYAGTGTAGHTNTSLTSSTFNAPVGITCDSSGNLYVSEQGGSAFDVRELSTGGAVSTYVASSKFDSSGGMAALAFDNSGNLYVANNGDIHKITPSGTASTFYSTSTSGVWGLAFDNTNTLYATDSNTQQVLKFTSSGTASVVAGNGTAGFVDGPAASAEFNDPGGIAIDRYGNIFVADYGNNVIRVITPGGQVSTIGTTPGGETDGDSSTAQFDNPVDLAFDNSGTLYVLDQYGSTVRKIVIQYQ